MTASAPDIFRCGGEGRPHVGLYEVVEAMRETRADMPAKHWETARGGLAVKIVDC